MCRSSAETKLSKSIRDALTLIGIWWIRLQAGKIPMKHGSFMLLCENGTPDIWTPHGFLEVKDLAKLSADQRAWHSKAKSHNVNVAVVRSPKDAIDTVLKWKREKENQMCNKEKNTELHNAIVRFRASHVALTESAVYRETLEAADAYLALTDGPDGDTIDEADIDRNVRFCMTDFNSPKSAISAIQLSRKCEFDRDTLTQSLKRIGALTNGGSKNNMNYYLPASVTLTDDTQTYCCDAPVTEKDTDTDDDNAPDNAPAKYDDETVDSIVRRALTGIDTPESALNVMRLGKECELDSKAITKSLKRIGALNNGGVKRGKGYYLPAVVAAETDEAEVE